DGNDRFDGGTGNDAADYAYAAGGVVVSLESNSVTVSGSDADTLISIEIVYGSPLDDTLTGATIGDTLYGAAGNDHVNGGSGNDVVYGDAGNDTLYGALGNDSLFGGTGTDVVDYFYAGTTVVVVANLTAATVSLGASDVDQLSSIEAVFG